MSYLKYNTSIIRENAKEKNLNCLPLDVKQIPKGFRLCVINTNILNIISQSLGPTLVKTAFSGFFGSPILPVFLVILGILSIPALSSQADSSDFMLVKKDSEDPFWPEDDMLSMDVLSVNDGTVVEAFNQIRNDDKHLRQELSIMGNHIVIDHGGYYSCYGHLSYNSIKVKKGDKVKKGQRIAKCGDTGNSSAPHLHFETVFLNNPTAFGIIKPLTGYEPYKSTPISWKEVFTMNDFVELLQNYYKKPAKIDNSGVIDSFAYIGDIK